MPVSVAVGSNPAPVRLLSGVPSVLTAYGWVYNANATNALGLGSPLAVFTVKSAGNYLAQFAASNTPTLGYFDDTTGNVSTSQSWANTWMFLCFVRTAAA